MSVFSKIAPILAAKPELKPYPNWVYGLQTSVYYTSKATTVQKIRRLIWEKSSTPFVITWLSGIKLIIFPRDETCKEIYFAGMVEPDEFLFLERVLKPGMTFVDIGANLGTYSLFAATKVGKQGRVISIEPSSREFERLKANCSLNGLGNVTLLKMGVSDRSTSDALKVAKDDHAGHNTLGSFVYPHSTKLECEETIKLETIDSILESLNLPHVDLIKIDIEGAEEKAFHGAKKTLSGLRPVILFECQELTLALQGASSARILEFLRSFDYQIYSFGDDGGVLPLESVPSPSIDLVAIPKGSESSWIS